MTLKQAYEVFYEPEFAEITEEFIRINVSSSGLKEAKVKLLKRYNQNIIKLRKEADPDNKILNLISTGNNLQQIINEINKAYNILVKCITMYDYKHDEEEEKLLFDEYDKYMLEQKEEKTNQEKAAMERAFNIYMYHLLLDIKKNNDYAKESITWEMNLVKMFGELATYKDKDEGFNRLRKSKQKQLMSYFELQRRSEFKNEDIKHIQQILAEEYYSEIKDDKLYEEISFWLKENGVYFNDGYHKDKKDINNFGAKVNQRIKNAKELYILIVRNRCIDFIEDKMNKINNPRVSEYDKIKYANQCKEKIFETEKLIKMCERKYEKILKKLEKYHNEPVTIEIAKEIEKMVQELITSEFLKEFNSQSLEHNKKMFQERLPMFQQNTSKINKIEAKGKIKLRQQISKNTKFLKKINPEFKALSAIKVNGLTFDELIMYHETIKQETKESLRDVIDRQYRIIFVISQYRMISIKDAVKRKKLSIEEQAEFRNLTYLESENYNMYVSAMKSNDFSFLEKTYTDFNKLMSEFDMELLQNDDELYQIDEYEDFVKRRIADEIIGLLKGNFLFNGKNDDIKENAFHGHEPISYRRMEIPENFSKRFKSLSASKLDEIDEIFEEIFEKFVDFDNSYELYNEIIRLDILEVYELYNELLTCVYNNRISWIEPDDSEAFKPIKK